jgi:DnaJ-class molecular chaperone
MLYILLLLPTIFNKDLYGILSIPDGSSLQIIAEAYKKLNDEHNPNKFPGDEENAKIYENIQIAYRTLKDSMKKRVYD